MTDLCSELLTRLNGRTFSTAESCTGGGIGAAFTAIPGSSVAYKGGIISYTNWVKENVLGVPGSVLTEFGAVSAETAKAMASGIRGLMQSTMAISVTGIAGPGSDDMNTPVGTVYIGFANAERVYARSFLFDGDRNSVRSQAVRAALEILIGEC